MTDFQVVVIGAGPAGLAAAIASAEAGAATLLIDENDEPGGQLRYRREPVSSQPHGLLDPQELAGRLVARAQSAGVTIQTGATAWGLFPGETLAITDRGTSSSVQPERIILATGSTDLALPFPGATLPGVFTARAVLLLLNHYAVHPGSRYVLLGQGPDLAELAHAIRATGGTFVTEFDPEGDASRLFAHGAGELDAVTLNGHRYPADVLVVAVGRQPDNALAIMAGCDMVYGPTFGGWMPLRDAQLRTSTPRIRIAGDAAGCCDIPTAMEEGTLAGRCAAVSLGSSVTDDLATDVSEAIRTRVNRVRELQPIHRQHTNTWSDSKEAPC
ncbi:MAG: NAD(P)/FAD-dependent oxidoreductase [Chloroflexota bacterium]|nr:NAD(P)/FAD-dependent oxidoreductase [Chloroflexota bacterium]